MIPASVASGMENVSTPGNSAAPMLPSSEKRQIRVDNDFSEPARLLRDQDRRQEQQRQTDIRRHRRDDVARN